MAEPFVKDDERLQTIRECIMSRKPYEDLVPQERAVFDGESPSGSSGLFHGILIGVIGALVVCGGVLTLYWYLDFVPRLAGNAAAESSAPQSGPTAELPPSPFLEHVKQAGIQACTTVFPALGQALTAGAQFSNQTQWEKTDPAAHSLQSIVGMNYKSQNIAGQAAGVVYAAPVGQGCEGNMIRIVPFQEPCQSVVAKLPAGSKAAPPLLDVAVFNLPNAGQALLLDAGGVCVVISIARTAG